MRVNGRVYLDVHIYSYFKYKCGLLIDSLIMVCTHTLVVSLSCGWVGVVMDEHRRSLYIGELLMQIETKV